MAKILSDERVIEYTNEFKLKVVELKQGLNITVLELAEVLDFIQ